MDNMKGQGFMVKPQPARPKVGCWLSWILCTTAWYALLVIFLSGCEKRTDIPETPYATTTHEISFEELCNRKTGDQQCTLKITGAANDSATVTILCGTREVATCPTPATIPAGGTEATCTIPRTEVVNNEGVLTHKVTVLVGNPTTAVACATL
ncbi:MAG: hypothetical protein AB7G75_25320 [Candidatus Binatia bacterium]